MEDQSCTDERRQHSKISEPRARETTKGGMVVSYGVEDTEHCLLDVLYNGGHLGGDENAGPRYTAGMDYRRLHFAVNSSGKSCLNINYSSFERFESDVETDQDTKAERLNRILKATPIKYRPVLRAVCIDDYLRGDFNEALDALAGAIEYLRKKY